MVVAYRVERGGKKLDERAKEVKLDAPYLLRSAKYVNFMKKVI